MSYFLSNYTNKVDRKGRVSVPASFRATFALEENPTIVLYPSFTSPAIEGNKYEFLQNIIESLDEMDPYSEEHDAFADAIISNCIELTFDKDGRIILPQDFLDFAGITDQATFVGRGKRFRIMNPDTFKEEAIKARKLALEKRSLLNLKTKVRTEGAS